MPGWAGNVNVRYCSRLIGDAVARLRLPASPRAVRGARDPAPQELPVTTPIVVSDLGFAWPDASPVFDGLDFVISGVRTALVGANGSGKSTLLRPLAGELTPAVSHDRELLERTDTTIELYQGSARSFGGTVSDYEAAMAAEQETARRAVSTAQSDLRRQRRELADASIKLNRRQRYGRKM